MAITPAEFYAPSGLTLTLKVFPFGSDVIANGAGGDGGTERTNCKGLYSADITQAATGWHDAVIEDGSGNVIGNGAVYLNDTTAVHRVEEPPVRVYTILPDAAADAAGGLPISDGGGLDLDTLLGRITGNVATQVKLLAYLQLLARSDAAIASDNATELGEINASEGSGAGDYASTTESQEAIRDRGDTAWITATSVTVSDKTGFSLANGSIVAATFGAGAIDTAAIADAAIDNATFAADVGGTAYVTNIIALAVRKALDDYDPPTKAELDALETHGDSAWPTAVGFNVVVPPSVAQFNARTLLTADYFNATDDTVVNVTTVETVTNAVTTDAASRTASKATGFAEAGDAMALTPGERNATADAILLRSIETVEATASEWSLCTVILAILESSISGTTWTIRRTGGAIHATKMVTTDEDADPVTGVT